MASFNLLLPSRTSFRTTSGIDDASNVSDTLSLSDEACRRERRFRSDFQAVFLSSNVASSAEDEVTTLADEVISDQIFAWVSDAERNTPFLKGSGRDSFGRWKGELVTGEGWRKLQEFGLAKGFAILTFHVSRLYI